MKIVDFLIIGGSAAGTTAAEVIRGLAPDASVTIISDENHEEYSRVLLPHYIRGKVSRQQVFLKKDSWYVQKKIVLLKGNRVKRLEASKKIVNLYNREQIQYGKLLIAVGGEVIKLDVPGADLGNIFYMRTIEDADGIMAAAKGARQAVVIGGGFIGLEFASCFKTLGIGEVTVLVLEDYYWQGKLDESSSKVLVGTLEKDGVKVLVNEEVDRFESAQLLEGRTFKKNVGSVINKSGKKFEADVVGVGIGIKSDLSWLEGSGIKINRAIVTNEYLETNLADVYAAGDCAEFQDVVFGRQHIMGNWANATNQGMAVGKTMTLTSPASWRASEGQAGQRTVFETASSYSISFFDGSCSFIGVTDDKFADEVVSRGSVEAGKMTRIYIKTIGGVMRVVGATVINNPAEVAPLTSAVKTKTDISAHKDKLSDSSFDLKNLLQD